MPVAQPWDSGGGGNATSATAVASPNSSAKNGPAGDKVDVADILSNFVSRGDKNLTGDQARKDYSFLIGKVGAPTAQKLINHVLIFNQRPDMQKQPFAQKLNSFYSMGSNDKDVDNILKTQLGAGPVALANSSPEIDTKAGVTGIAPPVALNTGNPLSTNKALLLGLGGK